MVGLLDKACVYIIMMVLAGLSVCVCVFPISGVCVCVHSGAMEDVALIFCVIFAC